ncbi:hypothetical protein B0H63DRAFT_394603 [Podospora didyma]|uniref:AB hydrolase-1 domain-containing protein n=1 Tax=Podospora didyma TaxID=330526 RepID=A0AAE0TZT5_9PEZI|nr:hypothetical protein B0H63DRAFT_394603 [Podospora didyma]
MLNHSLLNLVSIRAVILALQYAPAIEGVLLVGLVSFFPRAVTGISNNGNNDAPAPKAVSIGILVLVGLLVLEAIYALTLYLPHKRRLDRLATHPAPLSPSERAALFAKCAANVPDWERYLRVWFLGADWHDIKAENVREFLLWAFFDRDAPPHPEVVISRQEYDALDAEVSKCMRQIEGFLGREFAPGRGSATAFRLTLDPVEIRYHSVLWYAIVALVDLITHTCMVFIHRYSYYAPPGLHWPVLGVFPPTAVRAIATHPSTLFAGSGGRRQSPSGEIGYWLREHRSRTRLPVVFIHGIGIGLWPYTKFLGELAAAAAGDGEDEQIGVLALEILPISMRLTTPPLSQAKFLKHLGAILAQHGPEWDNFVLVSHSYGSVLTTHILRSPELGPRVRAAVLIDPVSVLLHVPDVAYNFTRRKPRTANEWQLWYFASMDMGVAETLARHFFWRENIIWREELLALGTERKVVVSLSGRDLIVDTHTVARYLASEGEFANVSHEDPAFVSRRDTYRAPSGLEILWFPQLDHAQVFDARQDRARLVEVIKRFSREAFLELER